MWWGVVFGEDPGGVGGGVGGEDEDGVDGEEGYWGGHGKGGGYGVLRSRGMEQEVSRYRGGRLLQCRTVLCYARWSSLHVLCVEMCVHFGRDDVVKGGSLVSTVL